MTFQPSHVPRVSVPCRFWASFRPCPALACHGLPLHVLSGVDGPRLLSALLRSPFNVSQRVPDGVCRFPAICSLIPWVSSHPCRPLFATPPGDGGKCFSSSLFLPLVCVRRVLLVRRVQSPPGFSPVPVVGVYSVTPGAFRRHCRFVCAVRFRAVGTV